MAFIVQDILQLRKVSKDTTIEECERLNIFGQLESTLKESKRPGVGLHGSQIGYALNACIIRIPENEKQHIHAVHLNMINPKILKFEEPGIMMKEGCLSLPDTFVDTIRYRVVTAEWMDYDLKIQQKAVFYGFEAVVMAHEVDHGMGVIITDKRAPEQEKPKETGRNAPCPWCADKGIKIKYKKCKEHFKS